MHKDLQMGTEVQIRTLLTSTPDGGDQLASGCGWFPFGNRGTGIL